MVWTIEYTATALKQLRALHRQDARRLHHFLSARVVGGGDPRRLGKALSGSRLGNYWRYRVGDYRVIVDIRDEVLRVLVVRIGHRRDIYR